MSLDKKFALNYTLALLCLFLHNEDIKEKERENERKNWKNQNRQHKSKVTSSSPPIKK